MKNALLLMTVLLCWGVTPIIEKIGLRRVTPFAATTIRSIAITIILLIVTLITGRTKEVLDVTTREVITFTISGFLAGLLAVVAYFALLKSGETSRVVPLVATYPLVTAICGYFILNEEFSLTKLLGTGLIVSGVWLVKM